MSQNALMIIEDERLRDAAPVYTDRDGAGRSLASLLEPHVGPDALLLAIPAGGVPVAVTMAQRLNLELDAAVCSKVTYAFNTEAGYGAVAFDGSLLLDERRAEAAGLSQGQIEQDVRRARVKVERRLERFRGDRPKPRLASRAACVIDDGLATGLTMQATVTALRAEGAERIIVAVPTGHQQAVRALAAQCDMVICANIRTGGRFAVAEAYENWRDVDEDEAIDLLDAHWKTHGQVS